MRTQRAQLTPADTNNATLYQVGTRASGAHEQGVTGEGVIRVCNTTGSAYTYRVFHDWSGATYGDATSLAVDVAIAANATAIVPVAALQHQGESLGVRSSNANSLTFTYEASDGAGVLVVS